MAKNNVFQQKWFLFALFTTISWGIWGALIEITEKAGFPATLGYVVWALTMVPCAIIALLVSKVRLEYSPKQIAYGMIVGLTGAGGQLVLFQALREGPAYIIFPIISLSPVVTIILSFVFLKERTTLRGWIGIVFALVAIFLLSYTKSNSNGIESFLWLVLPGLVFLAWGTQAVFMKIANTKMRAESIFTYMAISAVLMIPGALYLTDFSVDINYGLTGPYLAAIIQVLNSVGALFLVYALRYGKAIIVSPMTNALSPIITIIISLAIYAVFPSFLMISGMVLAIVAIYLFSFD
ncbi:DMT family transporter [Alkaliflexus imshenetskii]|uniref:DMT family transporter n=1 Tax=Alkaliflexus imshenetskii TaxID=286730 RepID=UPI00047EBE9D|nr:DMT family transporter [Alkaliflexus imshenetskii]